jgi:hypothetical protein
MMKRLLSFESLAQVGHLKNILEQSGINCLIKNEQLSGGLGEIPFLDCLPELWVIRDQDFSRAEALLKITLTLDIEGKNWQCISCGESNESHFSACWKCSSPDSLDD